MRPRALGGMRSPATGVNVAWKGWATSVWANQNGKWVTVFYQASTAK